MPLFSTVVPVSVVLPTTITINMAQLRTVIVPVMVTGTKCVEDTGLTWCTTYLLVLIKACVIRKKIIVLFLAHLNRRLICELIGYSWSGVRPSVCRPSVHNAQTSSSPKPLGQLKTNFMWSLLGQGGTEVCSRHLGHMTKMAATPIYGKTFQNFLLQNLRADFHETWYVASGTPAHHSLFK